jgi:Mg/Co/Ni transporter MgtE
MQIICNIGPKLSSHKPGCRSRDSAEGTEDVQKFGGLEALDEPDLQINFLTMMRKRAGWLCALFLSEMLTASAMQHFQSEIEKAIVLTLFIPLIMISGGTRDHKRPRLSSAL